MRASEEWVYWQDEEKLNLNMHGGTYPAIKRCLPSSTSFYLPPSLTAIILPMYRCGTWGPVRSGFIGEMRKSWTLTCMEAPTQPSGGVAIQPNTPSYTTVIILINLVSLVSSCDVIMLPWKHGVSVTLSVSMVTNLYRCFTYYSASNIANKISFDMWCDSCHVIVLIF